MKNIYRINNNVISINNREKLNNEITDIKNLVLTIFKLKLLISPIRKRYKVS